MRYPGLCLLLFSLSLVFSIPVSAAEVIPPKPDRYFNDYAHVVSVEAAQRFNTQLARFEQDTSNQVVVAIWDTMPSQSSIEDFTQRTFQTWQVGQKEKRNGVVLFVFVRDRRMRIQPGYGLEGALPDITCDQIIRNEIAPHFRSGDYEGGLAAGIDSVLQAIRGEYKGTGKTANQLRSEQGGIAPFVLFFFIFVIALIIIGRMNRRRGYRYSSYGGPYYGGWSGGSGGGWSSGGNGGGFGGFTGGGGSSGGGGASGSW